MERDDRGRRGREFRKRVRRREFLGGGESHNPYLGLPVICSTLSPYRTQGQKSPLHCRINRGRHVRRCEDGVIIANPWRDMCNLRICLDYHNTQVMKCPTLLPQLPKSLEQPLDFQVYSLQLNKRRKIQTSKLRVTLCLQQNAELSIILKVSCHFSWPKFPPPIQPPEHSFSSFQSLITFIFPSPFFLLPLPPHHYRHYNHHYHLQVHLPYSFQ